MKRVRTSTGHVTLIRVSGVGLCGGVVGRRSKMLLAVDIRNILTKMRRRKSRLRSLIRSRR